MEEIAGNKSFEHRCLRSIGQTGATDRSDWSAWRCVAQRGPTGQTDRHPETKLHSKTWVTTLKPIPYMQLKLMYAMMRAMVQKLLCKALK